MAVQAAGHVARAVDLEAAGGRVGGGRAGATFSGLKPPGAEIEGIPAKPEASSEHEHNREQGEARQTPGKWRQRAQDQPRAHGKAFRSSSKCGPSRSVGQSPPQTMAVPCRAAAALKAAAMRG